MNEASTHGSCLCGLVHYEMTGPLAHGLHCHCSRCRKHHGAAFATFVSVPIAKFRFLSGEQAVRRFDSSPVWYRAFCPVCASVLPTLMPEMDSAMAPAGSLDGAADVRPEMHMFVGSKAPWYDITDSLPQYEAYPPEVDLAVMPEPAKRPIPAGMNRGSCLCGGVAYEYDGMPRRMVNCHCSRCRKARSAAHGTNVFVNLDMFRFTQGESRVADFHLPGARYFGVAFCQDCGSPVARRSLERGIAVIPAAGLDGDPGMRATAHIYVGSKASWFQITDAVPQFPEMTP